MTIKCEVIKDLLPLYVDGVASEESCALIEDHLKECEDCRQYLELLREDIPDVSDVELADETASLRKIKRRMIRDRLMVFLVIAAFAVLLITVVNAMHLTEYSGTLDKNISYTLPEGYVASEEQNDDSDYSYYIRDKGDTKETLSVFYDGMYTNVETSAVAQDEFQLDDSTKILVTHYDGDNTYDNSLELLVLHDNEAYTIQYQCQETDKGNYFDSCSKKQEDELVEFVKTFDYHRPDGSDMNTLYIIFHNLGIGGFIILILSVLLFIALPIGIGIAWIVWPNDKNDKSDVAVSSSDLHESMNRERQSKGEDTLPSINTVAGASTNSLARRDHSWSSVPDFFIKLFRRKK